MTPVNPRWVLPLRGRWRRTLLWASLLLLLAVAQGLLVLLTVSYEASRAQDHAEAMAPEAGAEVKRQVTRVMQDLQPLPCRVLRIMVLQRHPRWVEFGIIDAGIGMAPEVAARLFTPFFSTRPEGMALGLSLCRTVVEQHGGALDFDSPAPGGSAQAGCPGTRFRFTLPAA
jgi:signal transduction histidine kinase